ncbi:biogenesis of lysosome-related organelles complex 1 subunit 4-like [Diadema antillarum]|uniref:biogenesis of lysosome-related organelles complex 1 subunit 4-like n=1 Tax=Diadema antillarum TaxID=105358 RepID=UPI003A8B3E08
MAENPTVSDNQLSADECVDRAASSFAAYLRVEPEKESKRLEEEIEEMLTKLEEFRAVVDMVRTDTSLALNRSLPEIYSKAMEMDSIFKKIDQLEEFVAVVRKNVMAYENLVNTAEKDLGTLHSIKSLLNSFPLFSSRKGASSRPTKKFIAPPVYSTSDYISKNWTQQEEEMRHGDTDD